VGVWGGRNGTPGGRGALKKKETEVSEGRRNRGGTLAQKQGKEILGSGGRGGKNQRKQILVLPTKKYKKKVWVKRLTPESRQRHPW